MNLGSPAMGKLDKNSTHLHLFEEAWRFLALANEAQSTGDRQAAERFIDMALGAFDAAEEAEADEPPSLTDLTSRPC